MLAGEVGSIGAAEGSLDMQLDLRDWENFHENLLKKTNILSFFGGRSSGAQKLMRQLMIHQLDWGSNVETNEEPVAKSL